MFDNYCFNLFIALLPGLLALPRAVLRTALLYHFNGVLIAQAQELVDFW